MELVLPDLSGIFILRRFREISTLAELIVSSCIKDIQLAVGAMKEGAYDYIITPKNRKHLHQIVIQAINSSNHVSLMNKKTDKSLLEHLDQDLKISIAQALTGHTDIYHKSFSADDILDIFPGPESEEEESNPKKLKKRIKDTLSKGIQKFKPAIILIVEDEGIYRNMPCAFLKKRYIVITARDAQKALAFCDSESNIDVIITTMALPDMPGTELVPIMKKNISIQKSSFYHPLQE